MGPSSRRLRLRRMWLISVYPIAAVQIALGLAGLVASVTSGVEWRRCAGIPLVPLVLLLYRTRSEPVTSLSAGWRPVPIAALIAAGTLAPWLHQPVINRASNPGCGELDG